MHERVDFQGVESGWLVTEVVLVDAGYLFAESELG